MAGMENNGKSWFLCYPLLPKTANDGTQRALDREADERPEWTGLMGRKRLREPHNKNGYRTSYVRYHVAFLLFCMLHPTDMIFQASRLSSDRRPISLAQNAGKTRAFHLKLFTIYSQENFMLQASSKVDLLSRSVISLILGLVSIRGTEYLTLGRIWK